MNMHVVICEDDKLMAELLANSIKPFASEIVRCDTLEAALKMVDERKFNIVTLDLLLTDSDKDKSLAAIKAFKKRGCAVVVISGVVSPHLREEAMFAGADAFVAKDGSYNSRAILTALCIASLKLPRDTVRTGTLDEHLQLLKQSVAA